MIIETIAYTYLIVSATIFLLMLWCLVFLRTTHGGAFPEIEALIFKRWMEYSLLWPIEIPVFSAVYFTRKHRGTL